MSATGHNNPPADEPSSGPFAIYRTAKIKTFSSLIASIEHMMRMRPTPNADPKRRDQNRLVVGSDDPERDMRALIPQVGQRHPDTNKMLRRQNSVLAIEVLLTASPEWWQSASEQDKADWERRSVAWLQAEYGADNVVHLQMHGDERTPHLTGYVVPLDPDTGGLNCRRWIGERQQLRDQQTAYALAVEPLGIKRGVAGSTAIHEAVQRVYGGVSAPETPIAVPAPPRLVMSPDAWAQEASAQMTRDLAPTTARAKTADSARTQARASSAQASKDRGRAERAEAALADAKEVAAQMRALPLADVLDALGFEQHPRDKLKWRADGFVIGIGEGAKAGKWFDFTADRGRGGAIDLVSHVMGTDFKGSVAWLADRFGPGAAAADVTAQMRRQAVEQVAEAVADRPAFTPPAPVPEHWPEVRQHLVEDRALPGGYIDKLHEHGDCYADRRRNAVFLCKDAEGVAVGAELKGTIKRKDGSRFSGMAPGSEKDRGGFRIGNIAKAAAIYVVESAIDAISLAKLRAKDGEKGFAIISAAGTTPEPRSWLEGISAKARKICGFDNDEVGEKAARKLRRHGFLRLRPSGSDWNDDLRAWLDEQKAGGDGATAPTPPSEPEFEPDPDPSPSP